MILYICSKTLTPHLKTLYVPPSSKSWRSCGFKPPCNSIVVCIRQQLKEMLTLLQVWKRVNKQSPFTDLISDLGNI